MGVETGGGGELVEAYEKHADDLTRFATGLVGPSEAQDVVSGALVRCLASPGLGDVHDARAYLFRAVFNEARMAHRSAIRRAVREARVASRDAVEAVAPPEVRPEVLAAVARLSVRQRAVTVLTYWADLAPADVARLLDIGEGSVRRHLARARTRLREVLDE